MALLFKSLLADAGIQPESVALLRHRPRGIVDPFPIWRTNRDAFESYQSVQENRRRGYFRRPFWASFAAVPGGKTLFLGLYRAELVGAVAPGSVDPLSDGLLDPANHDRYACTLMPELADFSGRLFIDWGGSPRAWVQRGNSDKPITELYDVYQEPNFPGYLEVIEPLSAIPSLPSSWADILRIGKGIYLLTCPKTKEQYVGKADGADGFWGRWMNYAGTGDGGNVRLKSRERSDYQVSILEIAGSAATADDIRRMEARWKAKLQTREMGLNGN